MLLVGRGGNWGVKSWGVGRGPSFDDRGEEIEVGGLRGDVGTGGGGMFVLVLIDFVPEVGESKVGAAGFSTHSSSSSLPSPSFVSLC